MSTQNKTADIAPAGGSDIDNVQLSGQAGQSLLGTLVNLAYQMATGKRILPQGQDPATAFVNDQAFRQFQHSIAAGSQSGAPMLANLIQGVGRTMGMSDTPEWRGIQMQLAQTFSQYLPMVRQVFPQIDMAYGMHNPMAWGSDLAHLPQFKDLARINDPGFAAKTQRLHELLYPGTPGDWDANHHFSEGLSSGLLSAGISKGLIRPDASAEEMAKFVRNMQAYTLPMYQKTLDSGYYLSGHEGGSALLDLFQRSTPAGVGWNPQQIAEEGLRRRWHEMQGGRAQGFFSHNNMSMDPDDPMRTPANVDALWESTEGRASSSMIANQLGALRYAQRFAKNPDAVEGVFKSFAQNPQSIIPMNVMIGAMRQSGLDAQTAAMMAATPGSYMYMTPEDHHLLPLAQGAEIGERMRAMGAKNFDWNDSHTAAIGNTVGAQYGFQPGMVRYLTPNMAQQRYAYEQYALDQAQKALPGFGANNQNMLVRGIESLRQIGAAPTAPDKPLVQLGKDIFEGPAGGRSADPNQNPAWTRPMNPQAPESGARQNFPAVPAASPMPDLPHGPALTLNQPAPVVPVNKPDQVAQNPAGIVFESGMQGKYASVFDFFRKSAEDAMPQQSVLKMLLEAKQLSDQKRYTEKQKILRALMLKDPKAWLMDSVQGRFAGLTHKPTNFKIHTNRASVPDDVRLSYDPGREQNSDNTKVGEEAVGIPDRSDYGDLAKLKPGQLYDLFRQEHLAERAGKHEDLRIGGPSVGGLFSWAARKGLAQPGERHLAIQQPQHSTEYGQFEGEIPEGYGKGTVKKIGQNRILVTHADKDKIEFSTADERWPRRFALIRPKHWQAKNWLMMETTPTSESIDKYPKIHFHTIPAEKVDTAINAMKEGSSAQEKLDGAHSLIQTLKKGVEVYSYRFSKKTGNPIPHTERMFGGKGPQLDLPKHLEGSVLRGELHGVKDTPDETTTPGGILPPSQTGGLLNSGIEKSLADQAAKGIKLKDSVFDIAQYGKQPVDINTTPYADRRKMLEEVLQYLPKEHFSASNQATNPDEAKTLWESIKNKTNPNTEEGMVFYPPTGKPTKAKLLEEADAIIRGTFEGKGKYQGRGVGGFNYSIGKGPVLGEVGTGLSDEMRADMMTNPDDYIGRTARIRHHGQFPSGAFREPALLALHEG